MTLCHSQAVDCNPTGTSRGTLFKAGTTASADRAHTHLRVGCYVIVTIAAEQASGEGGGEMFLGSARIAPSGRYPHSDNSAAITNASGDKYAGYFCSRIY